jgi:thiol-disulfide isomerase/thioredoxin
MRSAALLRSILLIATLSAWAARSPALEVGDVAPDWQLAGPGGEIVHFHEASASAVSVVLFWATWCPFCRTLMPHLQVLAEEFRGRGVRFYALNVWEDADPAAHLSKHGYEFELLLSAEPAAAAWGVKGTPGLFVVGPDRRVLYRRGSGEDDFDVEIAVRDALSAALR